MEVGGRNVRILRWMYEHGMTFDDIASLDIPYYKILQGLYLLYLETGNEFFRREYQTHCAVEELNDSSYLLIGDNHMGSVSECSKYLDQVLELALSCGVRSVLHGGDIGDGLIDPKPIYTDFESQVTHIVDDYPKIEGMRHKIVLGNHDKKYRNNGFNLATILKNEREDIDILGYGIGYLRLQSHLVSLEHGKGLEYLPDWYLQPQMRFIAHTHALELGEKIIRIPSLCINDTEYNGIRGRYRSGCLILNIENFSNYDIFCLEGYQFEKGFLQKTKEKSFLLKK